VKLADETIIKFRNGKELHMPPEMYEEIGTKGKGIAECIWTEGEYDFKVQFSWEDVLYIARTTRNTSQKDDYAEKTIAECVTNGVSSAIQKSIRDTDEADSQRLK
jgi:hypothetical protein